MVSAHIYLPERRFSWTQQEKAIPQKGDIDEEIAEN